MSQTMSQNNQGSVFFYILIAVILFAALGYAISQSSRGGAGGLSAEKTSLMASEIIEYGQTVTNAVQKLKLRGCLNAEISFDQAVVSGYSNTSSPSDNSCHIFDTSGAALNLVSPPPGYDSGSGSGNYAFLEENEFEGMGDTCGAADCVDIALILDDVNDNLCDEINEKLGVDITGGTPEDSDMQEAASAYFTGTFTYTATVGDEVAGASLDGQPAGCFYEDDGTPMNFFYQVILAR